jgi:hypothetical protein
MANRCSSGAGTPVASMSLLGHHDGLAMHMFHIFFKAYANNRSAIKKLKEPQGAESLREQTWLLRYRRN